MKYTIAIIGESYVTKGSENYGLAIRLGKTLIDNGYRIQHGGRNGIMEAVTIGAKTSKKYEPGSVLGILPDFDKSRANIHLDIAIPTGLDIMRNAIVVNADAVIAIGGGAGTLSEIAMAWSMKRLIIAYETEGWSGKLAGTRIDHRKRSDDPDDQVYKVNNEMEVVTILNEKLKYYSLSHKGI